MKLVSLMKKHVLRCLLALFCMAALYGVGRLYYRLTDGFTESNIIYDVPSDLRRASTPLANEKKVEIDAILAQEFHYLGKGCQSYVFSSQDGNYVLKFFKYQRFRPQAWLDAFAFIPSVDSYRLGKIAKKRRKLDNAFTSWQLAYEELQPETGVVYVHLDKAGSWDKKLVLYDKLGLKHELDINSIEFMIQKKARMLCAELMQLKHANDLVSAQGRIDSLLDLLLSEYQRGYADNDHALMQNTGVFDSKPIHIDVGQFVKNPLAANPKVYHQELFSKMWKFRLWLRQHYPELADYTEARLKAIIGSSYDTLTPQLNKSSMGRIPALGRSP